MNFRIGAQQSTIGAESGIWGHSGDLVRVAVLWGKVVVAVALGNLLPGQAIPSASAAPSTPTGLVASSITATSFTLRWRASTGGTGGLAGYDIYLDGALAGSATTASFTVDGLLPTITYSMTVLAKGGDSSISAASAQLSVTTLADRSRPTRPAGLTADAIDTSSIALSWTAAKDNIGVVGYDIFANAILAGSTTTTTAFTLTQLSPAKTYRLTVKARDAAGNLSAASPALTVATAALPPSTPASLVASALKATGFTLKWTASTGGTGGIAGYDVYRSGTLVGSVKTPSFVVTGLAPLTPYAMTVVSRDKAARVSPPSEPLAVTTLADTTKPTAPTALAAAAITTTGFNLTWAPATDNVGVASYDVFANNAPVGSATALSLAVANLNPGTTYKVTAKARDAAGNLSAASKVLIVVTVPLPLTAPTGLNTTGLKATSFTLKWTASTGGTNGIASYEVYRDGVLLGTSKTLAFVVSGLAPRTTSVMTVVAHDKVGATSPASAPLSVTTSADTTKPTVPTGLAVAAITTTTATLTWNAATDNVGVTGYDVLKNGALATTVATPGCTLTGLSPATTYAVTVRARDAAGNVSAAGAPVSVTTPVEPPLPDAPTDLAAAAVTATSFTLSWTAPVSGTFTGYDVFQDGALIASPTVPTLDVTGLTPDTAYGMTVRAHDSVGNFSPLSPVLTVTTANTPAAPTGLSAANITEGSFTLRWLPSTGGVGGIASYRIFRDGSLMGSTAIVGFAVTGLAPSTTYTMTVVARDGTGVDSPSSEALNVTTSEPANLPPTVTLILPEPYAVFTLPGPVGLGAEVSDPDGAIAQVEFFNGAASLGAISTEPYALDWWPVFPGVALLTARATDDRGATADSAPVGVSILPGLPYIADFEAGEGYAEGSLAGQLNWNVSAGVARIVAADPAYGARCVVLDPETAAAQIDQELGSATPPPAVVFVDASVQPSAGAEPETGTLLDFGVAQVVFVQADAGGQFWAFAGAANGAGVWQAVGPVFPVNATGLATAWHRLTVRLDFSAHTWDLFCDGQMIAADLGFRGPGLGYLHTLSLRGTAVAGARLDSLLAGADNPLFADVNQNGLADAWETANGLSLSSNNRSADPDGDELSVLREYLLGTNPTNPDTDGDGISDGVEVALDTNPLIADNLGPALPIAGALLHLRADLGIVTGDTGSVSAWRDASGHGNDAVQSASGQQPQLVAGQVNGLPVVRFDGVNDMLALPNVMAGAAAGEIFIVTRLDVSDSLYYGLCQFGCGDATAYDPTERLVWDDFGTTAQGGQIGPEPPLLTQNHIFNSSVSVDGVSILRFNGDEQLRRTGQTVAFRPDPILGSDWFAEWYKGDVAEVVVYDRVLTNAERDSVGGYLTQKYHLESIPVPAKPTLTASVISSTSADLTWSVPSPVLKHSVATLERKTDAAGFAPLVTLNGASSYTDAGLTAGHTYGYRVRLSNWAGASPYSDENEISTASAPDLPATGLRLWLRSTAGLSGAGPLTRWVDQSGLGHNAVQTDPSLQPQIVFNQLNGLPVVHFTEAMRTSLTLPDLMAGASGGEAFAVLRRTNTSSVVGVWAFGNHLYGSRYPEMGDRILDDFGSNQWFDTGLAPANLTEFKIYDVGCSSTTWFQNFDGVRHFTRAGSVPEFTAAPTIGDGRGANFDGDFAEIIVYDRVLTDAERSAINTYLGSKFALADGTQPTAPTGLTARDVTLTAFTLDCQPSTDDRGVAAYDVYQNEVLVGTTPTPSLNVTGLTPSTAYSMTVTARDAAGNVSPPSTALTVITPADTEPPASPTGVVVSNITAHSFTVSWAAAVDNSSIAYYTVFSDGVAIGSTPLTSLDVQGAAPSSTHQITVVARDAAGNSSPTSEALPVATPVDLDDSSAGDRISDRWKLAHGLSTTDSSVALADPDADGFTNLQEFLRETDPNVADPADLPAAQTYSVIPLAPPDGTKSSNWSPVKVTRSGKVLLRNTACSPYQDYTQANNYSIPPVAGYRWIDGRFEPLNHSPGWQEQAVFEVWQEETVGPYLAYWFHTAADISIADMNDRGDVIGSVGTNYAGYEQGINSYTEQFYQPALWPAGGNGAIELSSGDAVKVKRYEMTYTVSPGFDLPYYRHPTYLAMNVIRDSGELFAYYADGGLNYEGSHIGNFTAPHDVDAHAGMFKWNTSGATPVLHEYQDVVVHPPQGGTTTLKLTDLSTLVTGGNSYYVTGFNPCNDSGRYIVNKIYVWSQGAYKATNASLWGESDSPPRQVPGLEGGSALAINQNNDILGRRSDGTYGLWVWLPSTAAGAGSSDGTYVALNPMLQLPTGWDLVDLSPSLSDARMVVGRIRKMRDESGNSLPAAQQVTAPAAFVPGAIVADSNHDGGIMPGTTPDQGLPENAALLPVNSGYSGSNTVSNALDDVANGKEDLKQNFLPVFLDIKALVAVLPPGSGARYLLVQEDSAANFMYTNLTRATAFAYETGTRSTGFGPAFDQPAASATTQQITANGIELTADFLFRIRDQDQGVILIEGRQQSSHPIFLRIGYGGKTVFETTLYTTIAPFSLAVDADRDGQIKLPGEDASDATSATKPFRFWINDDVDFGDTGGGESDTPGQAPTMQVSVVNPATRTTTYLTMPWANYYADPATGVGFVHGTRDLVDYFPVYLNIRNLVEMLPPNSSTGIRYKLKQADGAVNFVYTSLTRADALKYQTHDMAKTFGPNFDQAVGAATKRQITPDGVELDVQFLGHLYDDDQGVLLIEGRKPTSAPLVLRIEREGYTLAEISLDLKIDPVETMFHYYNIRSLAHPAPKSRLGPNYGLSTPSAAPNDPFKDVPNRKNLVLVHGYNWNGEEARGFGAEMFKRFYWAGSKADMYVVLWRGDDSQILVPGKGTQTPDFHSNVGHAWQQAPNLRGFLQDLASKGDTVLMAHSLGNLVATVALTHEIDSGPFADLRLVTASRPPNVKQYFALNAAIPLEALDAGEITDDRKANMRHRDWKDYEERLWPTEWHVQFKSPSDSGEPTGDGRRFLTWRDAFSNLDIGINFHSSGDQVLDNPNDDGVPVLDAWDGGRRAWVTQEKLKGRSADDWPGIAAALSFRAPTGGWEFPTAIENPAAYVPDTEILSDPLPKRLRRADEADAAQYPTSLLPTAPFFRPFQASEMDGYYPAYQGSRLLASLGNADADDEARKFVTSAKCLAEAIPALSYAQGRNSAKKYDRLNGNIDVNTDLKNPNTDPMNPNRKLWPEERDRPDWEHGDYIGVSYLFVYPLYNRMVELGYLE